MEMKDTLSSYLNSEEQQMQQIQDKAKKNCMVSFRKLHSHLKLLSHDKLKGTRTESGFKRAFATLFEFHDTLIQHVESVKKSIDERAKHKEEYNSWLNERKMQTTEDKVDSSKALDASLVDTESSGTTLKEQDTNNIS
ncbi:hypothetical protein Tco_1425693 [Tanacetum coccineum]